MSGQQIANLVTGQTPSLLSAAKGNELIDAINALQNINIEYGEYFNATYGSNGVTLTIPEPQETEAETAALGDPIDGLEYTMYVCENGVPVQKIFYIKET